MTLQIGCRGVSLSGLIAFHCTYAPMYIIWLGYLFLLVLYLHKYILRNITYRTTLSSCFCYSAYKHLFEETSNTGRNSRKETSILRSTLAILESILDHFGPILDHFGAAWATKWIVVVPGGSESGFLMDLGGRLGHPFCYLWQLLLKKSHLQKHTGVCITFWTIIGAILELANPLLIWYLPVQMPFGIVTKTLSLERNFDVFWRLGASPGEVLELQGACCGRVGISMILRVGPGSQVRGKLRVISGVWGALNHLTTNAERR